MVLKSVLNTAPTYISLLIVINNFPTLNQFVMKRIFFLLLPMILIISTCEKKDDGPNPNDIVTIPDIEFLTALISLGVDTNGDGLISYGEAESLDRQAGYHVEWYQRYDRNRSVYKTGYTNSFL